MVTRGRGFLFPDGMKLYPAPPAPHNNSYRKKPRYFNKNNKHPDNIFKYCACPRCVRPFDLFGHTPIILPCDHTVCEECVRNTLTTSGVTCSECNRTWPAGDCFREHWKIREFFKINFYLAGRMYYTKQHGYTDMSHISFQSSNHFAGDDSPEINQTDTNSSTCCSLASCSQEATVHCSDCEEVFCRKCSNHLHKSARGLMGHKVSPMCITNCSRHAGNVEEFVCVNCNGNYCSYCIIADHIGHTIRQITKLESDDIPKFKHLLESCEGMVAKLKDTDKKVKANLRTSSSNTSTTNKTEVETKITKCFVDLHARLQAIEINLLSKMNAGLKSNTDAMKDISTELNNNIKAVMELVSIGRSILEGKHCNRQNIQQIMDRMQNALKMPCYLFNETTAGEKSVEFSFGNIFTTLDTNFQLKIDNKSVYKLVPEFNASNFNIDFPTTSSHVSRSVSPVQRKNSTTSSLGAVPKNKSVSPSSSTSSSLDVSDFSNKITSPKQVSANVIMKKVVVNKLPDVKRRQFVKNDKENVIITHINNPDSIFVQILKQSKQIAALHEHIVSSVNNLDVGPVADIDQDDICIVRCKDKVHPSWCRGRIIDTCDGEDLIYEVFLLDYGSTIKVKQTDLRTITPELREVPCMAYECKIYNVYPIHGTWNTKVTALIADIFMGCDIVIVVFEENLPTLKVDFITYDADGECSIKDSLIFIGHARICDTNDDACISLEYKDTHTHTFYDRTHTFKAEDKVDVVLAHVVNPHECYVRQALHQNRFNVMQENIQSHYSHLMKGCVYNPQIGMPIAVKCKSRNGVQWARARITEIHHGKGKLIVFLVDYGQTVLINWNHAKKLQERFLALECQAIKVALVDIIPVDDNWNKDSIQFLHAFIQKKTHLLMVVHGDNPLEIVLFECLPSVHLNINAMLVSDLHAISTGKLSETIEWPQITKEEVQDCAKEAFTMSLMKTVQGQANESDSDEEEVDNYRRIPVQVLHVENPGCIYIHLIEQDSLMTQLNNLNLKIQQHYNTHMLQLKETWEEADIGVAYNKSKKLYFRILVQKVRDDNQYEVFARDYASTFIVDSKNIGVIDDEFLNLPAFAIRCHMFGIKPTGNNWTLTAGDFLKEMMVMKKNILFTKIGQMDSTLKSMPVFFWDKVYKAGGALERSKYKMYNINKRLLDNGLAIKCKDWNTAVQTQPAREVKPKPTNPTPNNNDFWLPPAPIETTHFKAIATYVDENAHIYYHERSYIPFLKTLEIDINNDLQKYTPNKSHTWKKGDPCSVKYHQNNKWYRGVVTGLNPKDEEIEVRLIDYGNIEEVKFDEISETVMYADIPQIAQKIQLRGVYPTGGKFKTADLDYLHKFVVDHEIYISLEGDANTNPPNATVFKNQINVNQLMNDQLKSVPLDDTAFYDDDFDVPECVAEFIDATLPKENVFEISIINFLTLDKLVFELIDNKPEDTAVFDQLSQLIQTNAEKQPNLTDIRLNQVCIAKFDEDNLWYRGKVYALNTTSFTHMIHFVDFGNLGEVNEADIRVIKPEWMEYPLEQFTAQIDIKIRNSKCFDSILQHLTAYYGCIKRAKVVQVSPLRIQLLELDEDVLSYQDLIDEDLIVASE